MNCRAGKTCAHDCLVSSIPKAVAQSCSYPAYLVNHAPNFRAPLSDEFLRWATNRSMHTFTHILVGMLHGLLQPLKHNGLHHAHRLYAKSGTVYMRSFHQSSGQQESYSRAQPRDLPTPSISGTSVGDNDTTHHSYSPFQYPNHTEGTPYFMNLLCIDPALSKNLTSSCWRSESGTGMNPGERCTSRVKAFSFSSTSII